MPDDGSELRPVAKRAKPTGSNDSGAPQTSVLGGLPVVPEEVASAPGASSRPPFGQGAGSSEGIASASAPGASSRPPFGQGAGSSEGIASARAPGASSRPRVHIDPQWRDQAAKTERAVLQWTRSNDVVWARAVKTVLGEKLWKQSPQVFTDCEGIGAPLEALRIMEFVGALGPYLHLASGEIDQDARAWFLKHHRWPDRLFGDMLGRAWPVGIDRDLFLDQPCEIPHGADMYICGFPCCPFSLRKRSSALFEEEKVPHYSLFARVCI